MLEKTAQEFARHMERNAALRGRLEEKGVDLSVHRPTDVVFHAGTQHDAAVLGRELSQRGFLISLLSPREEIWVVEAGALVTTADALGDDFTEAMVQLGAKWGGTYDGWGCDLEQA
jgi:hypothetical protein